MFIVLKFIKFKLFIGEIVLIGIFVIVGILMDRRRVRRSMGSTAGKGLGWLLDLFVDCFREGIVVVVEN